MVTRSRVAGPATRLLHDSLGDVEVPVDAKFGPQTQRAVDNFPISGLAMPRQFIRALGLIKSAAAQANSDLGHLSKAKAKVIRRCAERVASGEFDRHFPIDVFQTGSGTSSNMNVNEVIAHLASEQGAKVHPNDHVNMGQSSNDVIPTAIQVSAALTVTEQLLPSLAHLKATLDRRARLRKTARLPRFRWPRRAPAASAPRPARGVSSGRIR
jgi:fumarate hydratase class II